MKHIISLGILLTAVFWLLIFPCQSSAETQTVEIQYREILDFVDIDKMFKYSSEDFDYHLKDDNTAILDYYYGKKKIVYIQIFTARTLSFLRSRLRSARRKFDVA